MKSKRATELYESNTAIVQILGKTMANDTDDGIEEIREIRKTLRYIRRNLKQVARMEKTALKRG